MKQSPSGQLGISDRIVDVSRETAERLEEFARLLRRWNRSVNLIAEADEPQIWPRHIRDSLQLLPLIPPGIDRAVDLGTGAGFPGLILAIATSVHFDLVEADRRKASFLREAARLTKASATVHPVRAETLTLQAVPLVTARALAALPVLLPWASRFLTPGGCCLFLKGAKCEAELTEAARDWHMRVERFQSHTAPHANILRISEIHRADRGG